MLGELPRICTADNNKEEGRMSLRGREKAQSVTEYSIFVAIVLLAIITMNVYVKRGLQGRYADVVDVTTNNLNVTAAQTLPAISYTNEDGQSVKYTTQYVQSVLNNIPKQYEPNYANSAQMVDSPRMVTETVRSRSDITRILSASSTSMNGTEVEKANIE